MDPADSLPPLCRCPEPGCHPLALVATILTAMTATVPDVWKGLLSERRSTFLYPGSGWRYECRMPLLPLVSSRPTQTGAAAQGGGLRHTLLINRLPSPHLSTPTVIALCCPRAAPPLPLPSLPQGVVNADDKEELADALTRYIHAKVRHEYRKVEACNEPCTVKRPVPLPENSVRPGPYPFLPKM